MALVSIEEQNLSLDLYYGASKGAIAASAHAIALFVGDPLAGGTELASTGGYARVTVPNNGTSWPAAAGGAKTSTPIVWATSTAAWSGVPTHWQAYNADTGNAGDSGAIDPSTPISVDAAGVTPATALTVYYNQSGA